MYMRNKWVMQKNVNNSKSREVGIGFVCALAGFFGYTILFAYGLVR